MPDDPVERLQAELLARVNRCQDGYRKTIDALNAHIVEQTSVITALTARLAALEQATPEEVVEMASRAFFDRGGVHSPEMWREGFRAAAEAIAAPLRAQEREACAQIADSFTCGLCGMDGQIAARIRAGGSGG